MKILNWKANGAKLLTNSWSTNLKKTLVLRSLLWKTCNKEFGLPRELSTSRFTLNYVPGKAGESQTLSRGPTFMTNDGIWFDCAILDTLQRRQLQKLCKKFGIRAVSKTEKLIQDLKSFHEQNLLNPSSILHSPFIPGSITSSSNFQRSNELSSSKDVDKSSGVFTSLDVSASSNRRDDELQRLCKTVGARTTSSRSTASSLDSLKTNLGELDKSFKILTDTVDEKEIFLHKKPSVSSILNFGSDKSKAFIISKWRKKKIEEMGQESFKMYQKEITQKGKMFHSYIKDFFTGIPTSVDSIQGYVQSVSSVLNDISCVIATEKRVSHYHLGYSGFLDTLALYKGIPCLIEWKTSEKPKQSLAECHDFPLQVAAYAGAINSSPYFSVPVTNGLVVVVYQDGRPAHVHKMDMQTCDHYWQQWLIRVYRYKQSLQSE